MDKPYWRAQKKTKDKPTSSQNNKTLTPKSLHELVKSAQQHVLKTTTQDTLKNRAETTTTNQDSGS